MASAIRKMGALTLGALVFGPVVAGSAGYAAWRVNWHAFARSFVSGPGRTSRLLLLLFVLLNCKNMPFAWTVSSAPPPWLFFSLLAPSQ